MFSISQHDAYGRRTAMNKERVKAVVLSMIGALLIGSAIGLLLRLYDGASVHLGWVGGLLFVGALMIAWQWETIRDLDEPLTVDAEPAAEAPEAHAEAAE